MQSRMQFCFYCNLVTEHRDGVCWLCVYWGMVKEGIRTAEGADEEEDVCPCEQCKQQREEK